MPLFNTREPLETVLRWLMLMAVVTVLAALAMPNAKSDAAQKLSVTRSAYLSPLSVNQSEEELLLKASANS